MAKFYGVIGYAVTEETEPGIYEERIVEKEHFGDVIRFVYPLYTPPNVNINLGYWTSTSVTFHFEPMNETYRIE